ncbi:DNA topoisomerase IB [Cryptosporangium phraense]|uniref:DNA topoisomerase n=1 Tax=Cryptosporangium phraense TaxID=2593070 RepID=A0A545AII1_9ACTN|nr:DNA topoisomerase IB [Cryptosporangium phraense]
MRLRRSDLSRPGYRRRKSGKGFTYFDVDGSRVTDPEALARVKALVIPPAWRDVWISPYSNGHIQAVGTDDAGRRQYRYHDVWREKRDAEKHDRVLEVARRLPKLRQTVDRHLEHRTLDRERVLAAGVRLLELGLFRIGGEVYAAENGSFGLTTIRKKHVTLRRGAIQFKFPAKSGVLRSIEVRDEAVRKVVLTLRRHQDDEDDLLAYRSGGRWYDVKSEDVNDYLRENAGVTLTAKDFRTWHATVLMAVELALAGDPPDAERARQKVIRGAVEDVAEYLGNTPTVARASYVDPRIITSYEAGKSIRPTLDRLGTADATELTALPAVERAVLRVLAPK